MWRKSNFPCIPVLLPRGDIDVEVGSSPFSISCHLNPENKYYRDGHRSDRLGIYANQARRSGCDESRKTHIQSSFKSFGNWLHTYTIQYMVAYSGKCCLSMPRPHWMKPVARTVKTTLDMCFPTFVLP